MGTGNIYVLPVLTYLVSSVSDTSSSAEILDDQSDKQSDDQSDKQSGKNLVLSHFCARGEDINL